MLAVTFWMVIQEYAGCLLIIVINSHSKILIVEIIIIITEEKHFVYCDIGHIAL